MEKNSTTNYEYPEISNRLIECLERDFPDKLDGRITREYWQERHNQWHDEKDKLIERLRTISSTSRT